MSEYLLTRNFTAQGAVPARRIVKAGASSGQAALAEGAGAALLGVADELGAKDKGRVDVHVAGIAGVVAGGVFAVGAMLTSDANGKAVAAVPAAADLRSEIVDGGGSSADIAVAEVTTADALGAVIELAADGSALVVRDAEITADGTIQSATDTTGKKLLVLWTRASARAAVIGRALGSAAADGDIVPVLIAHAAL